MNQILSGVPAGTAVDALGVQICYGDVVTVIAYGYGVRVSDTGRRAVVIAPSRTGSLQVEVSEDTSNPIAGGRLVRPFLLAVARRDGKPGHEGNNQ